MKKLAIAATLTASVFTLAACSSNDGDSEVIAETNAGDVTKEEFYQEMKNNIGEDVLREMVTAEVLKDRYDVSDEQIDQEVQNTKDQLGGQFDMFLQQQGFQDEEAYRNVIELSLLQLEAAAEDMDITEEDMQQRYDRMQTEIKAKHILVDDEETANEVKDKLDNGEDFADLAEEYSNDTASAENGGELDYFSTGDMVPEFEDAAYNMEVDEVSDPVESEHGFHIIKVTDKRETEEDIGSFEDNKDMIRRNIINDRVDTQALNEKINGLIEDADVDIQAEGLEDMFEQNTSGQAQG